MVIGIYDQSKNMTISNHRNSRSGSATALSDLFGPSAADPSSHVIYHDSSLLLQHAAQEAQAAAAAASGNDIARARPKTKIVICRNRIFSLRTWPTLFLFW